MEAIRAVAAFLDAHPELGKGRITVAFSGGYDSLCLLSCLKALGCDVVALYVDHRLRSPEELEEEARLNEANCRTLGVPLEVVHLADGQVEALCDELGCGIEAAARILRYKVFEGRGVVATAHNRDDQAESLMMRLTSGCTILSLSGIRAVRGRIVRPLLAVPRCDIVRHVDSLGLEASHDSTNDELFCMRNRMRHLVMDSLSEEVKDRLCRIAANMQTIEVRLDDLEIVDHGLWCSASRSAYLALSPLARQKALFQIHSRFSTRRLSEGGRVAVDEAVEKGRGLEGADLILRQKAGMLSFFPPRLFFSCPFKEGVHLPYGLVMKRTGGEKALHFDPSRLEGTAILRLSEEGDRMLTKGRLVPISDLLSAWGCPYGFVLQDAVGVRAVFASPFGGRDRLADSLLEADWAPLPPWLPCHEST